MVITIVGHFSGWFSFSSLLITCRRKMKYNHSEGNVHNNGKDRPISGIIEADFTSQVIIIQPIPDNHNQF